MGHLKFTCYVSFTPLLFNPRLHLQCQPENAEDAQELAELARFAAAQAGTP
jgi:hypothetical protein